MIFQESITLCDKGEKIFALSSSGCSRGGGAAAGVGVAATALGQEEGFVTVRAETGVGWVGAGGALQESGRRKEDPGTAGEGWKEESLVVS